MLAKSISRPSRPAGALIVNRVLAPGRSVTVRSADASKIRPPTSSMPPFDHWATRLRVASGE